VLVFWLLIGDREIFCIMILLTSCKASYQMIWRAI